MQKSQNRTDEVIQDFERNFGLRLQKLTETSYGVELSTDYQSIVKDMQVSKGKNDQPLDLDDPKVDAEIFERGIKRQFTDLKKNFQNVVDNIRTDDYSVFVKVNEGKAQQNDKSGAYNKLEQELNKLKSQIDKANQAKQLFNDFFSDVKNTQH